MQPGMRRATDLALGFLLLIAALPVMLIAAISIRLDSRGSVIYRQQRVGLTGKLFTLFKFRSMRSDAERNGPAWATANDPRVTRVGAFLRAVHIDELPQLFNVLRGDMSLIGPRPERPHFAAILERELVGFEKRLSIKPGLTGCAQVNCGYARSVADAKVKLAYDLFYASHQNWRLDASILIATVRLVLNAYGAILRPDRLVPDEACEHRSHSGLTLVETPRVP